MAGKELARGFTWPIDLGQGTCEAGVDAAEDMVFSNFTSNVYMLTKFYTHATWHMMFPNPQRRFQLHYQ